MYCTRKITDTLTWVGGNDRRLAMFEGVYSVPDGVSYNSYVLEDEKKKRELSDPSKMSDDSFLAFFNSFKKED